jgi:DNA topoisomerase-1
MPKPLVIVESPAKARTISRFLGPDFVVESSIGHVRDLPRNAAEVPSTYRGEAWARLGVDVDNGFKPLYVVASEKRAQVSKLRSLVAEASELYLATDEDREGESIAWHLLEVLAPRIPVKRMVFHEITPEAIRRATQEWRELDRRLVDAQEARRILDRLYGYEISPVLWKKVMPRLSAGRVQSVATRILVERERARMRFRSGVWWGVQAELAAPAERGGGVLGADLVALDGQRVATGRDFDDSGELRQGAQVVLLDQSIAEGVAGGLASSRVTVASVERRPFRRSPRPPFITSTLQQEAGRKLRFGADRTMRAAQRLYESGYITYMRTDSVTLAEVAVAEARRQAAERFGERSVPKSPRRWTTKVKNAQEAHEAIRPAGERFRHPDEVASEVGGDEARLYELIWKRTLASQMADAEGHSVQVRFAAEVAGHRVELASSGRVVTVPGFLAAYVEGTDDPGGEAEDQEMRLPPLEVGDVLVVEAARAEAHETQPPARFTEASLVKALEELGVGRPSTYASIISTIQDRGYVRHKGSALVPTFVAFAVVGLLERHFPELVDYGFTASMESSLDDIAGGREEAVPWLSRFYFGDGRPGLKQLVLEHLDEIDAREVNSIPLGTAEDGEAVVVRVGRFGPYLQKGERRANVPEDLCPDELSVPVALSILDRPVDEDRVLGTDPDTKLEVRLRSGRFGPYVQLGDSDGSGAKPKTASLLRSMDPELVDLDQALALLRLPRVVGVDPEDGKEITVANGRFGPYVRKGTDSRSLESEEQLFTLSLEDALALFAQPKQRRRAAPKPPLKELGSDPVSGAAIVVRDGRFGPYVTDGSVNASLRSGDSVESLTLERALDLLAARRDSVESSGGVRRRGSSTAQGAHAKPAKAAQPKRARSTGKKREP